MSTLYNMADLAGMKRSELQKLAKQHGIKANMKTDGLIKALAAVSASSEHASHAVVLEQEATGTSASSMEDQSEVEMSEQKPKSKRGRGRKQKTEKDVKESPVKEAVNASGDTGFIGCSEPESENQTSSATEDEKMSPAAKKSKAKGKGRGRAKRGRQTKKEKVEEPEPMSVTPANTGKRSRSLQRTPVVTVPTPPNSSSRKIKKAIRRTTHTPQPAVPAQQTSSEPTPKATSSSSNKRSSRSVSKAPLIVTPKTTSANKKTPVEAKTRGSTGKRSATGSAGGKAKKVRRGTFDKTPEKAAGIEAPKSNRSLKDEIMADIERKVQVQVAKSKTFIPTKVPTAKKTPGQKNWSKTHHGALDKMESIDAYLERKQKRAEALSASKKPKISVGAKPVLKAKAAFTFASPKPAPKQPKSLNFASPNVSKEATTTNPKSAKSVSFRVSKLKTPKKVTLPSLTAPAIDKRKATPAARKSISALTPGSVGRRSVGACGAATPAIQRKSIGATRTPSRKSVGGRKSLGAVKTPSRKSIGGAMTPFGKSTEASVTKPKNVFDLKASLSKPLAYKPHTGKLKPFGETQQNSANVRAPSNISTAKTLVKKPQLKGRDNRRQVNQKHRNQMRNNSFMANRGIAGC